MAAAKANKEEEEVEEAAPKKKSKKLLFIIIAVVVIAGGGGGYMFMSKKSAADPKAKAGSAEAGEEASADAAQVEPGAPDKSIVELEPFIVNLQDNQGTRYLKLTVNLEMSSAKAGAELTAKKAKVRDSLIILLSSKSYSDIGTVEGKYQMRDEIVARVNQFIKHGSVKTAYFTEFVIQ